MSDPMSLRTEVKLRVGILIGAVKMDPWHPANAVADTLESQGLSSRLELTVKNGNALPTLRPATLSERTALVGLGAL